MSVFAHQLLAAAAAGALLATGLRVASLAVEGGLLRLVAAIVLAAAAAVAVMLGLGVIGDRPTPVLLGAAAGLIWLGGRVALPAPRVALTREAASAWASWSPNGQAAAGAALGALGAWTAWTLRHPALGFDAILYHVPLAVSFAQDGGAGAVPRITDFLPVGAYPAADEVLLGWNVALSRSLVGFTVWPVACFTIIAAAGWAGLRELGVPRREATLAAGAVALSPAVLGWQFTGATTEPAALAWLVACAALCAGARRYPRLLPVAIVAAGLAIGTKTTTALLVAVLLAVTALALPRPVLRAMLRPMLAAAALGAVVGLAWYARNAARYGSPLWPFYAAPWGDPVPRELAVATPFWSRPRATVAEVGTGYLSRFGGDLLLLTACLLTPLVVRTRATILAAGATAVSLLLWTRAPFTGLVGTSGAGPLSTTRYLLPAVAASAVGVAASARERGGPRTLATAVLATALAINVVEMLALGVPFVPPVRVVIVGALAGALLGTGLRRMRGPAPRAVAAATLGVAVLVVTGLAVATPGYPLRHARTGAFAGELVGWFHAQPGWDRGRASIAAVGLRPSLLAGPELEHDVRLLPRRATCPEVAAAGRRGWLVVYDARAVNLLGGLVVPPASAIACLERRRPALVSGSFSVYRPERASAAAPRPPRKA